MEKELEYDKILERKWDELCEKEYALIAVDAAVEFNPAAQEFSVPFMGEPYVVNIEKRKIWRKTEGEMSEVDTFFSTIIIHYLINAINVPVAGENLSFHDLHGGEVYYPAFKARALEPLKNAFSSQPGKLIEAGRKIGAREGKIGDASIVVDVFPKVPLTLVVWGGDEEVPGNANILFDRSIYNMLPTEDLSVLSRIVVGTLKRTLS